MFTTLDLSNAYLEEESRKLTTINITKGLFEYVRLPYGVSSAPGIYQRIMEQLLQNIPMTVVYLDDIIVSGSTPEEHDRNLRTVLTRLLNKGLRLRKGKCVFRQKSCRYLGHVIDEEGMCIFRPRSLVNSRVHDSHICTRLNFATSASVVALVRVVL